MTYAWPRLLKAPERFLVVSLPDCITALQPAICRSSENAVFSFTHHNQFWDSCALAGGGVNARPPKHAIPTLYRRTSTTILFIAG